MKILDKYILKKISHLFFVVLILVAIIVVIDITEKMDKFSKNISVRAPFFGYYLILFPGWRDDYTHHHFYSHSCT